MFLVFKKLSSKRRGKTCEVQNIRPTQVMRRCKVHLKLLVSGVPGHEVSDHPSHRYWPLSSLGEIGRGFVAELGRAAAVLENADILKPKSRLLRKAGALSIWTLGVFLQNFERYDQIPWNVREHVQRSLSLMKFHNQLMQLREGAAEWQRPKIRRTRIVERGCDGMKKN